MSDKQKEKKVIDIIHKNCKLSLEQIALMTDLTPSEVAAIIDNLEKEGTILGYGAIINWNNLQEKQSVTAYIEIQVSPQRNCGFDRIAERIYQYPQVKSLNLMSGHYDLGLTVEASSIQEIAMFVSEHLSTMEAVQDTATHFVLKRYKSDGIVYASSKPEDEREVISI